MGDNSDSDPIDEFESEGEYDALNSTTGIKVAPRPIWEYRNFKCEFPGCKFTCFRHQAFADHLEFQHCCPFCAKYFLDVTKHDCPLDGQYHKQYGMGSIDQSVFKLELPPSHKGVFQTYEHEPEKQYVSLKQMFTDLDVPIRKLLTQALDVNITIKAQMRVLVDLENIKTKVILTDKWLSTGFFPITHPNFIKNYVKFFLAYITNTLEIWNQNESGYTLKAIKLFQIRVGKYEPLSGAGFTTLPPQLRNRRGLTNLHSSSAYCFHFCIAAAFYSAQAVKLYKNKKRICDDEELSAMERKEAITNSETYLPFLTNFNFSGLRIPVPVEDLGIFEQNNPLISVNCYGIRDTKIIPIRMTTEERERHVDLLLTNNEGKTHYVLISDLQRCLGKSGKHRLFRCKYCLRGFRKRAALNNHAIICYAKSQRQMYFPKPDHYQFKNMHETLRFPFVLYYDFETFSRSMNEKCGENTRNIGELKAAQYSIVLVGPDGFICSKVYDDHTEDISYNFLKSALKMAEKVRLYLKNTNNRIPLTPAQQEEFRNATACSLCHTRFTKKNHKIMHHCHVTGLALPSSGQPICHSCNVKARTQYCIPILSHGGTNFDHHLIVKGMDKSIVKSLKIIPQSGQKFMGFILNNKLKYMDSCKFMPGKLSAHAKALLKDGEEGFSILFQYFRNIKRGEDFYKEGGYTDDEIRLVLGKQAFPYLLMTNQEVFNLTELPPIEKFRNTLKLKDLKPETYSHAQDVWNTFQCATFRDYSRLYCMVDTLILACIVEAQRKAAFQTYGLEMLHKWSAPGFSHSAGMFSSKAKIQYIKDEEMVKMVRGGLRGGPCFCNTRLFTANNERIGNFNPSEERTHIFYADLKSLYPSCLLKDMPLDSFEWLTDEELENLDVESLQEDSGIGYIIECDLLYDQSLHDSHNDLPLAPEKLHVTLDHVSETQHDILKSHFNKEHLLKLSVEKLVLTLTDKESYVSYYKTLKFYLKHGLKIKGKVKRCIRFREGPVFRDYIQENLDKREEETSLVKKLVRKLAANSFYGKMLQSSGKFKDVVLCQSRAHALYLVAKAEFDDFYKLTPDLSIFIMNRKKLMEDSLFFIGFVVLELAKLRLMQVHYEGIKPVFGERISVAYSDTDSAIYLVTSDPNNTFIEDLKSLSGIFDYSGMKGHELFDTRNVGKAGVFKMEAMDITQFCGLSAKLYSYIKNEDGKTTGDKKAKGVSKAVVKHSISHEDYVRTVLEKTDVTHVDMNLIRSKNHQLYNQTVRKVALSALDLKRYLLPNGIDTLAIGHYKIKELVLENTSL